ncbi:hypothetical protein BX600DRAFT_431834 [Xylariales sp. PMI_506]|nr:hypothetical protein BX600DRAFT_431834 [Xylariales sp. PMI_506]
MPSAEDLFELARTKFLSAVSASEAVRFRHVKSANDLLQRTESIIQSFPKGRRAPGLLQKIKRFADNLEPYLKIVEVLCATHPEWSNIVFGALLLVLQLSSNVVTFFEKFCGMMETLESKLLRYVQMFESLRSKGKQLLDSSRLRSSLVEVYVSIFEIFEVAARIFTTRKSEPRRAPSVYGRLMWKPFDLRFKAIREKIEYHQVIIKEEFDFLMMDDIRSKLEEEELKRRVARHEARMRQKEQEGFIQSTIEYHTRESKESFLRSAVEWLAAPDDFAQRLEHAQNLRMEGTAEWLFDHPNFIAWSKWTEERQAQAATEDYPVTLWINGNPGCGKSILAASTVDELSRQQAGTYNSPSVCYYFFNQTAGKYNSAFDAIRSIAVQILRRYHDVEMVYNAFALAISDYPMQTKATDQNLVDLMDFCLSHIPYLFCVLDGLDEASNSDILIKSIWKWRELHPFSFKVALFSRPDVQALPQRYKPDRVIEFQNHAPSSDIRLYVEAQVEDMVDNYMLPANSDARKIVRQLVARSEGMFLWARLMVVFLSSPALTKKERLETIMDSTPDGLENMYKRIHARIMSQDRPGQDLATRAFTWIVFWGSVHQFAAPELMQALFENGWDDTRQAFETALILSCCSLIETDANGCYRLIHFSALEYVRASTTLTMLNGASLRPLIMDQTVAICTFTQQYIGYLMNHVPAQPLSGSMGIDHGQDVIAERYPLLRRASLDWPWLAIALLNSGMDQPANLISRTKTAIERYLRARISLTVWIEAAYRFVEPESTFESQLHTWQSIRQRTRGNDPIMDDIKELLRDLVNLDRDWGNRLSATPSAIWDDVTVFSKSRFWVSTAAASEEVLLETRKTKLGVDHPDTLTSMDNLALTYRKQGRFEEAEQLNVQVLETRKTKFGVDHPDTLTSMNNLASTYRKQGRFEEAEQLNVQVLETSKTKLGVEAISITRQAVDLTPIDHPDQTGYINSLRNKFESRSTKDSGYGTLSRPKTVMAPAGSSSEKQDDEVGVGRISYDNAFAQDEDMRSLASDEDDIRSQGSTETTTEAMSGKARMGLMLVGDTQFRSLSRKAVINMGKKRFVEIL